MSMAARIAALEAKRAASKDQRTDEQIDTDFQQLARLRQAELNGDRSGAHRILESMRASNPLWWKSPESRAFPALSPADQHAETARINAEIDALIEQVQNAGFA